MLFESMFEGFALLLLCSARLNSHGRSIRCTVIDKLRFRNPLLIEPSIWGVFISVSVSKNPHSHCLPTFLLPTFMHSKFSTILSEPYIYLMNIIFSEEGGQHRFLLLLLEGSFFFLFLSSPLLHLFNIPLSSCALLSSLFFPSGNKKTRHKLTEKINCFRTVFLNDHSFDVLFNQ